MLLKAITAAVLAVGAATIGAGPTLAGGFPPPPDSMPAPGVLGLVAMGVIVAIALARLRKYFKPVRCTGSRRAWFGTELQWPVWVVPGQSSGVSAASGPER